MDNSIIKATETITTSTAPAMPAEASPRPWRVEKSPANSNFWVVRCDNGVSVATAWHEADAAFIVEAVNYYKPDLHCDWRELTPEEAVAHCREVAERLGDTPCARDHLQLAAWIEERDRLRDLVERLVYQFEVRAHYDDEAAIIREAREAVGEGEL